MTPRPIRFIAIVLFLFSGGSALADDARWTVDWSTPSQAQRAERTLDDIERAFSEVLQTKPTSNGIRKSADLLISARTEHDKLRTDETSAFSRAREGQDRVARDTRTIMDRRSTNAWASLTGNARRNQLTKEDQYLRTVRTVTRNREQVHQRTQTKRRRVSYALQAFALSWGELAIERSAGPGMPLPNDVWLEHMELSTSSFNNFVTRSYGDCAFASARPSRMLRAGVARPATSGVRGAPTMLPHTPRSPSDRQPIVRNEPAGFPQPVAETDPRPRQPVQPFEPAAPIRPRVDPQPATSAAKGRVENIGGFQWYYTYAEAAAAARSQGKLILALSTRPGCSMCEKVKSDIIPAHLQRVSGIAVGFVYDIMPCVAKPPTAHTDNVAVNSLVRGNLPNAMSMPLVGFITPEKTWVAGFSGYPNQSEFLDVVSRASNRR